MVKVIFVMRDGANRVLDAVIGQTLLDVARRHGIDEIEGACGGAMACSTCHIILEDGWDKKLQAASDDETDMLDLAYGITKTSRLGCQIKLTAASDGLKVRLPAGSKSLL